MAARAASREKLERLRAAIASDAGELRSRWRDTRRKTRHDWDEVREAAREVWSILEFALRWRAARGAGSHATSPARDGATSGDGMRVSDEQVSRSPADSTPEDRAPS